MEYQKVIHIRIILSLISSL